MSTKVPRATPGESAVMDEAALLEWLEAADILMIRDEARRAAGWPSALSVHDIAYLQFPDTTAHGWQWRNQQDEARDRLIYVMNASIASGRLRAEIRKTEIRKPAFVAPAPAVRFRSIWSDGVEDALDAQRVARAAYDAKPELTIREYFVVHREDFASWAGLPEDKRCAHLRSWIGTTKDKRAVQRGLTKAALVKDLVREISARAAAANEVFDPDNAPGDLADFYWLACKWNSGVFGTMEGKSLRNHTSGAIKWSLSAGHNPSARPLYLKLFPEFQRDVGQIKAVS